MGVALPSITADIPRVLESLEMGFLPVPGLDPGSPSTSFKVRGRGLRVDLLAPAGHNARTPVSVPRFRAAAEPVPYLDLLFEGTVRAPVVDGGGILVNVPDPATFALHKLIVAAARPAVMHAKAEKDLRQAAQVFGVLLDERPGDVALAWEGVIARGRGWVKRAGTGLNRLVRLEPQLAARVRENLTEIE